MRATPLTLLPQVMPGPASVLSIKQATYFMNILRVELLTSSLSLPEWEYSAPIMCLRKTDNVSCLDGLACSLLVLFTDEPFVSHRSGRPGVWKGGSWQRRHWRCGRVQSEGERKTMLPYL